MTEYSFTPTSSLESAVSKLNGTCDIVDAFSNIAQLYTRDQSYSTMDSKLRVYLFVDKLKLLLSVFYGIGKSAMQSDFTRFLNTVKKEQQQVTKDEERVHELEALKTLYDQKMSTVTKNSDAMYSLIANELQCITSMLNCFSLVPASAPPRVEPLEEKKTSPVNS